MSLDSDALRREKAAESLYRHGREALQAGERARAKQLLLQAVDYDRNHSEAWLWLSATTDDRQQQKHFLEWAIAADASNAVAIRGLGILSGKINASDLAPDGYAPAKQAPEAAAAPAEVERTFRCPRCGGALEFTPGLGELHCGNCGYIEALPAEAADGQDQVLDFALPTRQGQGWAVGERPFTCKQCGATMVAPPGRRSETCPFCGATAMLTAAEDRTLLSPQALIPMRLDQAKAEAAVTQWLKKGYLIPGDLNHLARDRRLQPVYVPFWIFECSLNARWRATVSEPAGRGTQRVERTGERTFFMRHYLQPGTRALPADLLRRSGAFDWNELVAYDDGYLAGWPAGTYDVSLAEASLEAREGMIALARWKLRTKAVPGQTLADVQVTSSEFIGQSYQLVLLPLWIGHYEYQKTRYRLLVNGQTAQVVGDRPLDWIKIALIVLVVLAAVAPLLILLVQRYMR